MDGKELFFDPEEMQLTVIENIYDKGHLGCKKDVIKDYFYFPKIKDKIEKDVWHAFLLNCNFGKQEEEFHPIPKEEIPLQTYHIDHLEPLESTNKNYKHILSIIDAFTKFVWPHPFKTISATEVISKLKCQSHIFGNPTLLISDKGPAITRK